MRGRVAISAATMVVLVAACTKGSAPSAVSATPSDTKLITIGVLDTDENRMAVELYAQALEADGYTVERRESDPVDLAISVTDDPVASMDGYTPLDPSSAGITPVIKESVLGLFGSSCEDAVNEVSAALTKKALASMTEQVASGDETPEDLASIWLQDQGIAGGECEVDA